MKETFPWAARLGALAAAGALLLLPPATQAQRRREPPPEIPPPVQPLAVKVQRGQTCEIMLRTYGRKLEPLKYLIRTPPEHGRLTNPRPVERDLSVVTYTPPADLALVRDRFSYAVQNSAGVSAPAEVVITIVDAPPALELPASLDFPPVLAGASVALPLEITNRGGGIAEGRVSVEAPWKIEGAANYRLAAGARAVIRLVFAPAEPGKFDRLVRFSSQPDTGVGVHGEARAALLATPAQVVLQHGVGDPVRSGAFELSNQTDKERRVLLTADARLLVPADIAVPPQGSARVAVQTAAGDVAALEGEVRVEAPGLALRVPVRAAPVAAVVRAMNERVAFGRVNATTSAGASVELENIGGTAADVKLTVAPPFAVETTAVKISPGEKKAVALRTQPAAAGTYRAALTVVAGAQKLELPVEAELFAPAPPPEVAARELPALDRPPASAPAPEAPPSVPAPAARQVERRLAATAKLTAVTPTSASLEWPAEVSAATQFRVEKRRLMIDETGALKIHWEEMRGVTFRREGGLHFAALRGLKPATAYGFRVVALGPEEGAERPLFLHTFATPGHAPVRSYVTPLRILLAVLVVCVALIIRQRRAERRRG